MSASSGKTVFSLSEAAELLHCHRETLRRAIRNGELRAAKLGRSFRISRFDLESFWTASGGGELFDKNAPEQPAPLPDTEAPKEKRARKKPRKPQQQLSFLNALDMEDGKNAPEGGN